MKQTQYRGFKLGKNSKIVPCISGCKATMVNCISHDNRKRKNLIKKLLRNLLKYTIGLPILVIITIVVLFVWVWLWVNGIEDDYDSMFDIIKDFWRPIR